METWKRRYLHHLGDGLALRDEGLDALPHGAFGLLETVFGHVGGSVDEAAA